LEEAVALDGLMREYTLTQDQVASAIGKSRSAVANTLRLLKLHDDVQSALRSGTITEGHAKCLAGLTDHAEQLRLLEKITKENLSVRDLEILVVDDTTT
jgi:ParB family chromosome partitioning protein